MADTPISVPAGRLDLTDDTLKILLHMDGVDASTTFTEESGRVVTVNGNAQIDTAQSVFGGASGLFDGTGDYLTIPDAADIEVGSGDFTVTARVRFTALPGSGVAYAITQKGYAGGSSLSYSVAINNSAGTRTLQLIYSTNGTGATTLNSSALTLSTGTWYTFEVSKVSGTVYFFQNGDAKGSSAAAATFFDGTGLQSVAGTPTGANPHNGHIDELALFVGKGFHTTAYIPKTDPFDYTVPVLSIAEHISISPSAGSLTATGQSVALAITQQVDVGSGTASISAGDVSAGISYFPATTEGTGSLTGQAVSIVIGVVALPGEATATITGQSASEDLDWAALVGAITSGSEAPVLYIGTYLPVAAGSASVTGAVHSNLHGFPVSSSSGSFNGASCTITVGKKVTVSTGGVSVVGHVPSIPVLSGPMYNLVTIEALF